MEGDRLAPKKESSFEIITSSDDDDMMTASMYSSAESVCFESLNRVYFLKSLTSEASTEKVIKTNCNSTENQSCPGKLDDVELSPCLSMVPFENSVSAQQGVLKSQKPSRVWYTDLLSSSEASKNSVDTENIRTPDETKKGVPNEMKKEENKYSKMIEENALDNRLSTGECISNVCDSAYDAALSSSISDALDPKNYDGKHDAEKSQYSETGVRHNRLLDGCSLIKCGLRVCRNIQNNRNLQNLASGIKSSFYKYLNTFELEMNSVLGMKDPLNIYITAETSDSLVIEEAFYQSLSGQVIITKLSEVKDFTMPVLPVGYKSALLVAQSKLQKARLLYDYENTAVIISTAAFITEIYPQRWQLSNILCLEDPNFMLNLHNFTSTVPVPNEYVLQAQRLTPDDYPAKDLGLAVTLDQAIGCAIDNKDLEETLCCVPHSANLKSAASILAGMYSKYVNRYVQ